MATSVPYFDLVREMKNHRLHLVESAKRARWSVSGVRTT
jgi:hypothetical protein